MTIQRYRRKPEQGGPRRQAAARYLPGTPLDDLLAVARMADGELAEVMFPSYGPVLLARFQRHYDEHPSGIEYVAVEPGKYLATALMRTSCTRRTRLTGGSGTTWYRTERTAMSVRVGESWQARNGRRRWVSMSLGDLLFGLGAWAVLVLPLLLLWWLLLAELWLAAETVLTTVTGVAVLAVLALRQARPGDVRLTRLRFGLVMVDLKGRP